MQSLTVRSVRSAAARCGLYNTVLVIMLTQKYSVYFRTEGYIYLRNLKRTLRLNKTNSPLRKHPDSLMSYEIILKYGIGAENSLAIAADGTVNDLTRGPSYPQKRL